MYKSIVWARGEDGNAGRWALLAAFSVFLSFLSSSSSSSWRETCG
jgi:hypothetical protein